MLPETVYRATAVARGAAMSAPYEIGRRSSGYALQLGWRGVAALVKKFGGGG